MLLTIDRMRQVTDNCENLVKIQIFLQVALGSVKVLGDSCFFFFFFLIFNTVMFKILRYPFVA